MLGLLIAIGIIAFWIYYGFGKSSNDQVKDSDEQTPTLMDYKSDVKAAEDVKNIIENKYKKLEEF